MIMARPINSLTQLFDKRRIDMKRSLPMISELAVHARRTLGAVLVGASAMAAVGLVQPSQAATLDQIKQAGKITLGYREDAKPFSYKDEGGKAAGFTVTLCNMAVEELKSQLQQPNLAVEWVPVAVDAQVDAVQQGKIDLMCGAASVSLASRKLVSFSIPIFPGGIGAIASSNTSQALRDLLEGKPSTAPYWRASPARLLSKRTFAVVKGSADEAWLADRMKQLQIDAIALPVDSYAAGVKALTDGNADVFFGNRSIIQEAAGASLADGSVVAIDRQFTNAPLAIGMQLNSDPLRLVVDTALSKAYDSSEFRDLYVRWFGMPDASTLLFYTFASLPQ